MKNRASTNPEVLLSELSECVGIIDEKDNRLKELEKASIFRGRELAYRLLLGARTYLCAFTAEYAAIDIIHTKLDEIFKENGVEYD